MEFVEGPWISAFAVELPGSLMSKSNFRRGGSRAASSWRGLAGFAKSTSLAVHTARPESWVAPDTSVGLPDRPVVVSVVVARSLLDAGNFHKSVLDACEGVLFVSDAQVRATLALAERGRAGQWALAGFAQVRSGASLDALASASAALGVQCTEVFAAGPGACA